MSSLSQGSLRRSHRVGPSGHSGDSGYNMVELRNGRHLHVLHLNPRPRDARFQQEMVLYLQYRKSGPGAVGGGPLTMPRRQAHVRQQQEQINKASSLSTEPKHPLSVTSETNCNANPEKPDQVVTLTGENDVEHTVYEAPSGASSLLSSPTHTMLTGNTRSASSVLVALHNQHQSSQGTEQLPKVPDSEEAVPKLQLTPRVNGEDQQPVSPNTAGPLSPETQSNDAATCPDLYTSRQEHATESDVTSPKSITSNTISSSCPIQPHDPDLVMFFIHGVGGSADIWRGQTDYFARLGYEIVAPDLIGHGLSCAPHNGRAYHFREIAADMEELFDKYCKRRNVLIGHSYGASFATLLARTRARRVTRLILVSGGPPSPLAPQPGVFTLPICLLACMKPCLTHEFHKGAFYRKTGSSSSALSAPRELAFQVPTKVLQFTMNGQDWPDGDELYHNWLTSPTLLLYGEKDGLVALHEEQEMQRAIFDSRLVVIPKASHMVMMEASAQVNSLILSFLQHPSPPDLVQSTTDYSSRENANSSNRNDLRTVSRSKSRKSLRSAKSRPQRLLSKSLIM